MSKRIVIPFKNIQEYADSTSDLLEYVNDNNLTVDQEIITQDGEILLILE